MPTVRIDDPGAIPVGQGKLVEGGGRSVAVFNAGGGRFYACGAACPHEHGPLADGWLEGTVAICPWHGFDFDLETGRCRADDALFVPVYQVRASGGGLEVDLP